MVTAESSKSIVVVLGSSRQPIWVHRILKALFASPLVSVTLVVHGGGTSPVVRGCGKSLKHILYRLYSRGDRLGAKTFHRSRTKIAASDEFSYLDICDLRDISDNHSASMAQLSAEGDVDVVLCLDGDPRREELRALNPQCGIWYVSFGDESMKRSGPPGFWEVIDEVPTTTLTLWSIDPMTGSDILIHHHRSNTVVASVTRNRERCYRGVSDIILRELERLHRTGRVNVPDLGASLNPRRCDPGHSLPVNMELALPLLRYSASMLLRTARRALLRQWVIGVAKGSIPQQGMKPDDITWLLPPRDRFWADPFPARHEGRTCIYFEEEPFSTRKGHISAIELRADGTWDAPSVVLTKDYHLSYPFIFKFEGTLFMVPETHKNHTIDVYRCTRFPYTWEYHGTLMAGVQAVDTTIHEIDDKWWMFTAIDSSGVRAFDELHIFYSDNPMGPWHPHAMNPVVSDTTCARPAGGLMVRDGMLLRPAQDCSGGVYGRAITLRKIVRLNEREYEELECSRISELGPGWPSTVTANHTLNQIDGLWTIDSDIYRPFARLVGRELVHKSSSSSRRSSRPLPRN